MDGIKEEPVADDAEGSQLFLPDNEHLWEQQTEEEDADDTAERVSWYEQFQETRPATYTSSKAAPVATLPAFPVCMAELMLCSGDWPAPQSATVAVLEPILGREVTALARRAATGPPGRPGQPLGCHNLLWALRRDPVLVGRVLHHLETRKFTFAAAAAVGEAEPDELQATQFARCTRFCEHFGFLPPRTDDPEAAARRERLDRLTRYMTAAEYDAFSAARSRTVWRVRVSRVWVDEHWPEGVPKTRGHSWHMMWFLVRELTALLVDACMLVRAEGGREQPGLPSESLTPEVAREAVRRLQMAAPPRADMLLVR